MINRYRKGRAFEYRLIKLYRDTGYDPVIRSSGSHGPFDIIAFNEKSVTLTQCKSRKPSRKEIEALKKIKIAENCSKWIVWPEKDKIKNVRCD